MPEESSIDLKLRTDNEMAKRMSKPHLLVRPALQRKNCWSQREKVDFIDSVARGWKANIFMINRFTDDDGEDYLHDEVFDGAHRLEAIIDFMNDKFVLIKLDELSPLKLYEGKRFSQLPSEVRQKLLSYTFNINFIDQQTADDNEGLRLLWKRLNKAGKKLNDFEVALPVIRDLVKYILEPSLSKFYNSDVFQKKESKRGEGEKLLQVILATGESEIGVAYLRRFSSKQNLVLNWQNVRLGEKITKIRETVATNKEKWIIMLDNARKYLQTLSEDNCFVNDEGINLLDSSHRGTELVFLLGRLVYHFPKPELFRRLSNKIAEKFKQKFLQKVSRGIAGRNGIFQTSLLLKIDELVQEFVEEKVVRNFKPEEIEKKLLEQDRICGICKKPITVRDKYHGDHIIAFAAGGKTEYSNLCVTHKKCNLIKGTALPQVA